VTIQRRDSRISTKVGHAIREKLGLDIQAQLNKRNGNGNGKKFDWQEWNNTVFPKLVGRPDELKYDVEVVALEDVLKVLRGQKLCQSSHHDTDQG